MPSFRRLPFFLHKQQIEKNFDVSFTINTKCRAARSGRKLGQCLSKRKGHWLAKLVIICNYLFNCLEILSLFLLKWINFGLPHLWSDFYWKCFRVDLHALSIRSVRVKTVRKHDVLDSFRFNNLDLIIKIHFSCVRCRQWRQETCWWKFVHKCLCLTAPHSLLFNF